MKRLKIMTLGMCLLAVFSCNTKQGTGALIGAGGGGVIGAIIGKIAGNTAVGAAIGSAVGAGTGAIIGHHMDKVAEEAAKIENAKVDKVTDTNGLEAVRVTFDSGILFATGSSNLNTASQASLSKFSTVLKNNQDCHVDIYGHTDNEGWKNSTAAQSEAKNQTLSEQRAQSVANYLRSLGVSNTQLKNIAGQGQSNPVADNSTAAGRQQNRRVEVYLYASQAMVEAANSGTLK